MKTINHQLNQMERNQPHLAPSKDVEKEIEEVLYASLPLKPKTPAFRSTPVATKVKKEENPFVGFKSAKEVLTERGNPPPNTRNEVEITEHPLEYVIKKNNDNFAEVKAVFHPRIPPPKRSLDEFLVDNPDVEDPSQVVEMYWRNKYARKVAKLHNLRMRLRAVGLTNIQLSDEHSVALTQVAALKGANAALHFHNQELQRQIALRMKLNEYAFRTTIGMALEEDDDEELTPTLEELYSDEILPPETPVVDNPQVVPGAPPRENNNNADPRPSGAPGLAKLSFTPIIRKPSIFD